MFMEMSLSSIVLLVIIVFSVGRFFPIDSTVRKRVLKMSEVEENKRMALFRSRGDWMCVGKTLTIGSYGDPVVKVVLARCEPSFKDGVEQFRPIEGCRLSFINCPAVPFGEIVYLRFKDPNECVSSDSPWGNLLTPVLLRRDALDHHLLN